MAETLSRRERMRAATVQEIKDTARRMLVGGGTQDISLRAIAREMGLTAPALYRYFDSQHDLVTALVADLYAELADTMEAARDARPAGDVSGRLRAVSRAFRLWALAHPREFGLIFGSPLPALAAGAGPGPANGPAGPANGPVSGAAGPVDGPAGAANGPAGAAGRLDPADPAQAAAIRFGGVFGELVAEVYERDPFPTPAETDLDPVLVEQLAEWCTTFPVPLQVGVVHVFLSCWIRLYGAVCLEVFGHLQFALRDAGPMFESELHALGDLLGIGAEYLPPHLDSPTP